MKDPRKGQHDIFWSACLLRLLHSEVSRYNVSRTPVQLPTARIFPRAVGVVSPVSARTLAAPHNNLCACALAKNR